MKSIAMVLCVFILQYSRGVHFGGQNTQKANADRLFGFGRHDEYGVSELVDGMIKNSQGALKKSKNWLEHEAKELGEKIKQVGRIVDARKVIRKMDLKLVKKITDHVGQGLNNGWGAVKTVKLPGWKYVMAFPNAMMSVVDQTTGNVWFLVSEAGKSIVSAEAFSIYVALQAVSVTIGPVMRILRLDCIEMKKIHQKIGKFLVDEIDASQCNICHVSHLKAVNNVTITSDNDRYLVVQVPYVAKDINVKIRSVNVSDYSGLLLENTPMTVNIKKTIFKGTINFRKGSFLKFVTIKLRIVEFIGFDLKVDVDDDDRTNVMDIVEGISDILSLKVQETVNKKLRKVEERISKTITGRE